MKEIDIKANSSQPPALTRRAFTLVELLIVISVIGVLAAFTVTTLSGVFRNKYISTARSEMAFIQAGIDRYKATYGVYPPSGDITQPNRFTVNPLYFELQGVTNDNGTYYTLDRMNNVKSTFVNSSFGVDGFLNSSKGSGEDAVPAKIFLPSLKANQIGSVTNPPRFGQPGGCHPDLLGGRTGPELSTVGRSGIESVAL